jgi:hypothetical protein
MIYLTDEFGNVGTSMTDDSGNNIKYKNQKLWEKFHYLVEYTT